MLNKEKAIIFLKDLLLLLFSSNVLFWEKILSKFKSFIWVKEFIIWKLFASPLNNWFWCLVIISLWEWSSISSSLFCNIWLRELSFSSLSIFSSSFWLFKLSFESLILLLNSFKFWEFTQLLSSLFSIGIFSPLIIFVSWLINFKFFHWLKKINFTFSSFFRIIFDNISVFSSSYLLLLQSFSLFILFSSNSFSSKFLSSLTSFNSKLFIFSNNLFISSLLASNSLSQELFSFICSPNIFIFSPKLSKSSLSSSPTNFCSISNVLLFIFNFITI